jgi:hypothetical protein
MERMASLQYRRQPPALAPHVQACAHRPIAERTPFQHDAAGRFGLVPNFFVSAPSAPEVIEKLWDFAKAAYIENPMPSLFKERLFVFLSRFCPVRYCIIRHCGFLVGRGNVSGDPQTRPQDVDQVIHLLRCPTPWRRELDQVYSGLEGAKFIDWPAPDTDLEDWIFAASALIFVEPGRSERALKLLLDILGDRRFEYLMAFLAFVRTAHFWTVVHPGLEIEDDVREMMSAHPELATLLLQDPDFGRPE